MRAVRVNEVGNLDSITVDDIPSPEPAAGQVRVKVHAAGASFADGLQASGRYQFKMTAPYTPGGECAGEIDAIGEGVEGWKVGDRVLATTGFGSLAEQIIAVPRQLTLLPSGLDFARGSSFLHTYGTAWFALTRRITVAPGEFVLVNGAGGGVGLAAIDVAVSLGAAVIGVASTEEKRAAATAMGAFATIDSADDVKVRARELSEGVGVDVVYDVVGGEQSEPSLRAMRFGGRFCVIGFTGGIARVPLNLPLLSNRSIIGVEWGSWAGKFPVENTAMVAEIVAAIDRGDLHPVAPTERPLEEAAAVYHDLLERRAVGKIVLVP